jgi:hypothetical protein
MSRPNAALLAALACFAGAISGTIAAAQADTGSTGSTGATGSTGTTGSTGSTGSTALAATITVNGAGYATVDPSEPTATIQTDYLGALGAAVTDAQNKAGALATQLGTTLGPVQSITEESNDDGGCNGPVMFAATPGAARGTSATSAPSHKPKHKHHKATARIADDSSQTCTIEADVTISYAMS